MDEGTGVCCGKNPDHESAGDFSTIERPADRRFMPGLFASFSARLIVIQCQLIIADMSGPFNQLLRRTTRKRLVNLAFPTSLLAAPDRKGYFL